MARILISADAWQRSHPFAAVPVAIVRKFLDDRASSLAALVTYYAFFSVFPLVLAFVSILGFVLQSDPSLRDDVVDSTLGRIPVVGSQLDDQVEPLSGSTVALVAGLATSLWAGLGVMSALTRAFETIWDVPRLEQRGVLAARARGTGVLLALAAGLVVSTFATGSAIGGAVGPVAEQAAALVLSLALNAAVFLVVFWLLNERPLRLREVAPGLALVAVGSLALQAVGGWYVGHAVSRASDTYGAFAVVIGLLSWFWLGANLLLLAAEVNVVVHRRLWPRSLTGELAPADREVLRRSAGAARRDAREEVLVRFSDEPAAASALTSPDRSSRRCTP